MTCLKPSTDIENETKKYLYLLKIRKIHNQKWKQKMTSDIHRRAAQNLLNSLCFFHCHAAVAYARHLRKRYRRHCWQAIVPSNKNNFPEIL